MNKRKPTIKISSTGHISAGVSSKQDEIIVFGFVQGMTLEKIRRKNPVVAGIIKGSLAN